MMLAGWSSSEVALLSCHECAPSQVGTHLDMTLDIVRMLDPNKQAQLPGHRVVGVMKIGNIVHRSLSGNQTDISCILRQCPNYFTT